MATVDDHKILTAQNSCQPKNCRARCEPTCGPSERCVLDIIRVCGECPLSQCVNIQSLGMSVSQQRASASESKPKTALMAGLITGLVGMALVSATIVGFVFIKRRKRAKHHKIKHADASPRFDPASLMPPVSAVFSPKTSPAPVTPTSHDPWLKESNPTVTSIGDPFAPTPLFLCASSLHIPRFDASSPTQPANAVIRRSLNILPSPPARPTSQDAFLNRSSSVKVTKYDNLHTYAPPSGTSREPLILEDSDDEDKVQIRRAVSVRKNQQADTATEAGGVQRTASVRTTGSKTALNADSSVVSLESADAQPIHVVRAKPTMVRINTITKKEGGITRKRSVRTVIDNNNKDNKDNHDDKDQPEIELEPTSSGPPPLNEAATSTNASREYLSPASNERDSRQYKTASWTSFHSGAGGTHSTVGDGEITVFWETAKQSPSDRYH
ncbi:uncharacterized protein BYT42DRAFT_559956 [Radiomyces spectabilis]|uniref:uncharacterized protein n=1 Tax=Radiomyces spectabilis TaxID=64574 RepID=UPI002220986B|nr:uncharacterized protein BYT42DRAFT_559956 [Radiomyces spectabilis]KAI8388404.1 hypothetical protein BYT42DRAFT_559956 [Radiomyces spectabilis]